MTAESETDPIDIDALTAELRAMTVTHLRDRYREIYGESTRSGNREHLVRRIIWRVQAMKEGGLPERARQRALAIANDADLRARPPRVRRPDANGTTAITPLPRADLRVPMPGTLLRRQYKDRTIVVRVLPHGFEYEGEVFRSLSAIANLVTGSHWNGSRFFGFDGKNHRT